MHHINRCECCGNGQSLHVINGTIYRDVSDPKFARYLRRAMLQRLSRPNVHLAVVDFRHSFLHCTVTQDNTAGISTDLDIAP